MSGYRLMCGCRRLLALGLIAFLLAGAAGAAERMYAVQVPVADRSSPARAEALRQAMQQLLVRVTGERDAARLVGIEPLLAQPEQYVQQFRYLDAAPAADAALELNVHFDGTAVERVLRANGLPVWGRERPPLLLWLAVGGDQRRLIGADSDHPLYAAAMGVARERGLTLLFPLLDLEDQARVGYADVWGGFEETVLAASQRYRSQLVLQGRLQAGAGGWRGRWTLHMGRDRLDWDSVGDTAAAALAQGLHLAADRLALRLAVRALGTAEQVERIRIRGVATLEDYARTLDYLAQLTPVRDVEVLAVDGDAIDLLLALDGDRQTLERLLDIGRVLTRDPAAPEPAYRLTAP
ncbi:hypothetical protein TspCOW1_16170 [Thiohalobacter sp. COW1]|uniref:DUF2066 domain-containing protein n=1 Tax=Thiohalobacter thiocyanaticus TaxID=585455 RepID=A0A1Z4VQE5_9GAMM|nr:MULTISPECIES: DUF2066 domain-containing protein [Thiohalobacter]BAZ93444.1 uncharacterized protein FOKN1_1044 [Thiohalobacter thiocyanaticus]BCO31514.1 hypothetical protein TspCOW1_16170 [Thiohalobacter sp. COW1]